jgi:hypothetical protein
VEALGVPMYPWRFKRASAREEAARAGARGNEAGRILLCRKRFDGETRPAGSSRPVLAV